MYNQMGQIYTPPRDVSIFVAFSSSVLGLLVLFKLCTSGSVIIKAGAVREQRKHSMMKLLLMYKVLPTAKSDISQQNPSRLPLGQQTIE